MKNRFVVGSLCLLLALSLNLKAQLPDGSIAPNWTLEDLNGNEHSLYDYLDAGKAVVIDFSATWCPPCWSYHNSGALENLYIDHGPAGMPNVSENTTDDVMVFFIEGDGQTSIDDLYGTGSNTQGNWVEGTPYPIINSSVTAQNYSIPYWPTIYRICQNRTIIEIGQQSTSALYADIQNCPQPANSFDCTIEDFLPHEGIICTDSIQFEFTVRNNGFATLTSFDIEYSIDEGVVNTYNWSGSLGLYYTEDITLPVIGNLDEGNHNFDIKIVNLNGETDENPTDNEINANYNFNSDGLEIKLYFMTDANPGENTWKIEQNGELIISGGNYDDPSHIFLEKHCLDDNACFDFTLEDATGDGMGSGSVTLKQGDEILLRISGNAFETSITEEFCIGTPESVFSNLKIDALTIYPNPTNGQLKVNVSEGNVFIYNLSGQQLMTHQLKSNNNIDVSNLPEGIYIINIVSKSRVYTAKFSFIK